MCLYKYWLNVHVVEKKIPLWCGYYHHSIDKWQFYYLLSALKPTEFERKRALISAVCEILWKAGDGKRCCVCLLQDKRSYPQDHRLRDDDVTEFVRLLTDSETTAPLYKSSNICKNWIEMQKLRHRIRMFTARLWNS